MGVALVEGATANADSPSTAPVPPLLDTEKEDPVDIVLRALRILPGRVIDAFRVMDADMSGTMSLHRN